MEGLNDLVHYLQTALNGAARVRQLQEQVDTTHVNTNLALQRRVEEMTAQLQHGQRQYAALESTWTETMQSLITLQEKYYTAVQTEEAKPRRVELEDSVSVRLKDYDRLALENRQLQLQVQLAQAKSIQTFQQLTQYLLTTSKNQVLKEIKAYSEDQERSSRYLMRFVEKYPTFVYWSDGEQEDEENQLPPQFWQSVEGAGASCSAPGTTSDIGTEILGGPGEAAPVMESTPATTIGTVPAGSGQAATP